MKVKLKEGNKLSYLNNYCGLDHKDWLSLNQGQIIVIDQLNKHIENQVEIVKSPKKGDK